MDAALKSCTCIIVYLSNLMQPSPAQSYPIQPNLTGPNPTYLSIYLSVCLFVCLSVCLIHPSIYPSIYLANLTPFQFSKIFGFTEIFGASAGAAPLHGHSQGLWIGEHGCP